MAKTVGLKFEMGARLDPKTSGVFQTVDAKIKGLRSHVKELEAASKAAGNVLSAKANLSDLQATYQAATAAGPPTRALYEKVEAGRAALARAERAAKNYNITIGNAAQAQAKMDAAIAKANSSLDRQAHFAANAARRRELGGSIIGTVASAAAVAAPLKLAMNFQDAMAGVRNATNLSTAEFAKFSAGALTLPAQYGGAIKDVEQIAVKVGLARVTSSAAEMTAYAATGLKVMKA